MTDIKPEGQRVTKTISQPVEVEMIQLTMPRETAEALRSLFRRGIVNSLYDSTFKDIDLVLYHLDVKRGPIWFKHVAEPRPRMLNTDHKCCQ